jgi:hypothetical protein
MQHHVPILFKMIPEGTLDKKNYFSGENIQVIAEVGLVNHFLYLEQ